MDARDNTVRVSVPATAQFAPVARIAVSGLAIRLGFDVGDIEQLRLAVAAAANAMADAADSPSSSIERLDVTAAWDDERFTVDLLAEPPALGADAVARIERETGALTSNRLRRDVDGSGVSFLLSPGSIDPDRAGPSDQPELPKP